MRSLTPTHLLTTALAAALAITLSGCTPPTPPAETKSRHTEAAPLFASEEEALAAAEKAYAAYVALADRILMSGGLGAEELMEVLTGDYLAVSREGFENIRREGLRSTGAREFRNFELQSFFPDSTEGIIAVYVCEDITGIDLIDAHGKSAVSASRPDTTVFEATFDLVGSRLLLSGRDVWKNTTC